MATFTLDWSETDLGGSAVVSYASGAVLDFTDKPAGATSALSLTPKRGDSINVTIAEFSIETLGSSVMTFDYHTSSESGFDKLHIDVDGVSQANFSGTTAWTTHAGINIASAGTHTIRFRYQKDGGGLGGEDRVWVALLNITNTVTTNDDSGTTTLYDMEDGSTPSVITTSTWTNSTSGPITGSRSMRSPASPADSGSYDLTVTRPAASLYRAVGFDWKVSSEAGWDKLYVFPDPSAANVPASGHPSSVANPGWLEYSGTASGRLAVILPAAESSILLRYAKDASSAAGSDAAWIDTLRLGDTGGGTTSVTATRATTWNTKAPVTATRATLWDLLASTTATRATSWDVRAAVTATRATTWNVAALAETLYATGLASGAVATSANALGAPDGVFTTDVDNTPWTARFDMGNPTGTSATGTHTITLRVRKETGTGTPTVSSITLYAGSTSLGTIGTGPWNVTSTTGEDITVNFASSLLAGHDLSTVAVEVAATAVGGSGGARTTVQLDAITWTGSFSTAASVTATRSTTWDVTAATTATRSTTWRARASVAATRASTWDVLTSATPTRASTWDTLSATTSSRSTTWTAKAPVTATRATTWNVDGTLGSVTATRATTWDVRTPATSTRATTWDTTAAVTATRASTWRTRQAATGTRSSSWDTLSAITRALATSWDVRTATTAIRSTTWNVASTMVAVTATRSTSWNVIGRITATRAATWDARALVAESRATTWDTRTVVTRQAATTWRTLAAAEKATTTSWRTLERITADRATTWNVQSDALPMRLVVGTPQTVRRYTASTPEPGAVVVGAAHPPRYTVGGPT